MLDLFVSALQKQNRPPFPKVNLHKDNCMNLFYFSQELSLAGEAVYESYQQWSNSLIIGTKKNFTVPFSRCSLELLGIIRSNENVSHFKPKRKRNESTHRRFGKANICQYDLSCCLFTYCSPLLLYHLSCSEIVLRYFSDGYNRN